MDADGSNPIRIADETFAVGPQCSPDGKWVVYLRGPSWTPVRVPITGEKPPEVLAQDSAFVDIGYPLRISPDGKRIAYLASPEPPREPQFSLCIQPNQLKVIPSMAEPPCTSSTGQPSAQCPPLGASG